MNEEYLDIAQGIVGSITNKDVDMLDRYISDVASYCFKNPPPGQESFSQDIFLLILRLMKDQGFLDLQGSHHLLLLFEYDWGALLDKQKEALLEAIKLSYGKYSDEMSHFVLSEILGEYYCNEPAFQVLNELQNVTEESARIYIPHGYEHIAKEAINPDLRKRALTNLVSMKKDKSLKVRIEVDESLSNLGAG